MRQKRVKQLRRYLKETCKIQQDLALLEDERKDPIYSTIQMSCAFLIGSLCRTGSVRQLERRLRRSGWRRFMGFKCVGNSPTEGTLRYFLPRLQSMTLRQAVVQSTKRLVRSKMVEATTLGGLRLVSVDGTQPFSTVARTCGGCIEHIIEPTKAGEEPRYWYDHKIVDARLVGDLFSPWLGFVSQNPVSPNGGYEGEEPATLRLLDQLALDYGREFFDAIVADALHANRCFLEKCKEYNWWSVFVAKDNAKSLRVGFESRPLPKPVKEKVRVKEGWVKVTIWEQSNIYLTTCAIPLRVFKIKQTVTDTQGYLVREEVRWLATTIPQHILDAVGVWWLGWRRWEIENGGHRTLKREHHAAHPFCHTNAQSVENMLWFLLWGQNLLEAFGLRRLQSGPWGGLKDGLVGLVEELVEQMVTNTLQEKWEVVLLCG